MKKLLLLGSAVPTKLGMLATQHMSSQHWKGFAVEGCFKTIIFWVIFYNGEVPEEGSTEDHETLQSSMQLKDPQDKQYQ